MHQDSMVSVRSAVWLAGCALLPFCPPAETCAPLHGSSGCATVWQGHFVAPLNFPVLRVPEKVPCLLFLSFQIFSGSPPTLQKAMNAGQ
jgi:hypothetical protein